MNLNFKMQIYSEIASRLFTFRASLEEKFSIGISTAQDASAMETFFTLSTGKHLTLTITPLQVVADDTLKETTLERGCLFSTEKALKFFKYYTKALCQFECSLNYSLLNCGCTPWNFPQSGNEILDVCDLFGNMCFHENMKQSVFMVEIERFY